MAVALATKDAKSADYSTEMQARMGTTLTYNHDAGLNYNRVLPDLIVGSCLQTAADAVWLAEKEKVTTVFCLQEDSDMEYFNLDIVPVELQCRASGIRHVRFRVRDFDPFDLRKKLPEAVAALAAAHDHASGGTVYIHCTAGLGRAPAVALAYMSWLRGWQLDAAFDKLREVRVCSPRLEAIRSASSDMLLGVTPVPTVISMCRTGTTTNMQVAGLDVGWNQRLDMSRDPTLGFVLRRDLMPGRYVFKFIADDMWSMSADHPTLQDGTNTNNWLDVMSRDMSDSQVAQQLRLLAQGQDLTDEERVILRSKLTTGSA